MPDFSQFTATNTVINITFDDGSSAEITLGPSKSPRFEFTYTDPENIGLTTSPFVFQPALKGATFTLDALHTQSAEKLWATIKHTSPDRSK